MKAQDVNALRKLLADVSGARQDYVDSANVAHDYQKRGAQSPGHYGMLLDVASAKGGTLMNVYNALYLFLDEHHDEILEALRASQGKRKNGA